MPISHSILETIQRDLTQAQKEKNEVGLLTLRLLKAGLKNAEIAKRPQTLVPEDEMKVLKNEVKKHEDSIEMFTRGNRIDLVSKEKAELEIIKKYLPEEMGDEELKKIVKGVVAKLALGREDFGKAMGAAMKEVGARADGNRVRQMVKEILNNF